MYIAAGIQELSSQSRTPRKRIVAKRPPKVSPYYSVRCFLGTPMSVDPSHHPISMIFCIDLF